MLRPSTAACALVLICTLFGTVFADQGVARRRLEATKEEMAAAEAGNKEYAVDDAEEEGGSEEGKGDEEGAEGEGEEGEGEEGEGEEGEEGEEEEEEFNKADIEVACMLLGSVSFVMVLLRLVNWHDDDVRRYAWRIISATMSIFAAVLFFQGNMQMLELFMEEQEFHIGLQCLGHYLHCLVYLCALAATIVRISGSANPADTTNLDEDVWVVGEYLFADYGTKVTENDVRAVKRDPKTTATKSVYTDKYKMEVTVEKKKSELFMRTEQMRCWATLLAHMGGFAAIRAGGALQHMHPFKDTPAGAFLAMVLTAVFLLVCFHILGMLRDRANSIRDSAGASKKGTRKKLMTEEVVESENDVLSLAMSFLTVQALRFVVSGVLPDPEGLEEPEIPIKMRYVQITVGAGFLFVIAAVGLIVWMSKMHEKPEGHQKVPQGEGEHGHGHGEHEEEHEGPAERLLTSIMNAMMMCFAWCLFWGSRWYGLTLVKEGQTSFVDVHKLFGTVVMALVLSFMVCGVVIFLDQIEDKMKAAGGAKVGPQAIQSIILSLGILVGFAWEHCFDVGVCAMASKAQSPAIAKFFMGIACVLGIVPPWRSHILSKAMHLENLYKIRQESAKNLAGEKA